MFRKIIKYTSLLINLFFVLLYLCGLLSSVIPADKFVWFSYLGLAFPLLILIQIGFIIFWITRKKWLFLISLGVLIISYPAVNRAFTFPFHSKQPIIEGKPVVKLLTYNVAIFGGEKEFKNIMHVIDETDADIVCLQEFGCYMNHNLLTQHQIVSAFRKRYPYRHLWYKNQRDNVSWGVATFSKYPIVHKEKIEYTSDYNVSVYSDIVIDTDTVRIFNNHLESNKFTIRDLKHYKSLSEDFSHKKFWSITEHMSYKLGAAYQVRAQQARAVRDSIAKSPYPVVVCGDFNDVPQSYAYRTISKGLCDIQTSTSWGYNYTFHSNGMFVDIDHVLVSKEAITPLRYSVIHKAYSDHYPVLATWQVK
ncbi:MAG: endonuclease/exonuclease/phosphatase family protein [Prevotellaceae bacterium]|nr:endonuclease/exonuclease/phosphatase family protein [Prevotellaceae bacterium]